MNLQKWASLLVQASQASLARSGLSILASEACSETKIATSHKLASFTNPQNVPTRFSYALVRGKLIESPHKTRQACFNLYAFGHEKLIMTAALLPIR